MRCNLVTGFLVTLLSAVCSLAPQEIAAAAAHFWISESDLLPGDPNTPTAITSTEGLTDSLHVWARPETGKKLRNISLNLVALDAGVDFIDASITVHNYLGTPWQRYAYVSDSTSVVGPPVTSEESFVSVNTGGNPDSIEGLQGYSLSAADASIRGVGDQCVGAEPGCAIADDGQPAWLIASVDFTPIVGGPATDVHLQMGSHGMNHESIVPGDYDLNGVVDADDLAEFEANYNSTINLWPDGNDSTAVDGEDFLIWQENLGMVSEFEPVALTSVQFGADSRDGVDEPIYDAGNLAHRNTTLAMDDPDATITIVAPLSAIAGPVPEPSTLCLVLFSILGPVFCRSNR